MRFLPKSEWPTGAALKKLGVSQSLSQIERNNLEQLARGRKKRAAGGSATKAKKSKSKSKASGSRSKSKTASKAKKLPRMSGHEMSFRRFYDQAIPSGKKAPNTAKNLRKSMMYDAIGKMPLAPKAPKAGRFLVITNADIAKKLGLKENTVLSNPYQYFDRLVSQVVNGRNKATIPMADWKAAEARWFAEAGDQWYGNMQRGKDIPFDISDPNHEFIRRIREYIRKQGGRVVPDKDLPARAKKAFAIAKQLVKDEGDLHKLGYHLFYYKVGQKLNSGVETKMPLAPKAPTPSSAMAMKQMKQLGLQVDKIMNSPPFGPGYVKGARKAGSKSGLRDVPSANSALRQLPDYFPDFFTSDGKLNKETWFRALWSGDMKILSTEITMLKRHLRSAKLDKYIPLVDRGLEKAREAWKLQTQVGKIEEMLDSVRGGSVLGASVSSSSSIGACAMGAKSDKEDEDEDEEDEEDDQMEEVVDKMEKVEEEVEDEDSVDSFGAAVRKVTKDKARARKSNSKARKSKSKSMAKDRKDRAWAEKKNQELVKLMKQYFGKRLELDEYKALPDTVKRELQLQAYEKAFPQRLKHSPEGKISNKARQARREAAAKKAAKASLSKSKTKSKSKSASVGKGRRGRRPVRKHSAAPEGADGQYPGRADAIQDFIRAYMNKDYKTEGARAAAMTRDLKKSNKVVNRKTSYNAWKKAPWDYDLGGIDTEGSEDSFIRNLRKGGFMANMSADERKQYL